MTTDHTPGTTGPGRSTGPAARTTGPTRTTGATGNGGAPGVSGAIGATGTARAAEPPAPLGPPEVDRPQLRADIERTRENIGDPVEPQTGTPDLKTRAKLGAEDARDRLGTARGGAALAASTGAVLAAVWLRRRRRARPLTSWQRTMAAVQETGAQARDRWPGWRDQVQDTATGLTSTVTAQARQAAAAPDAAPRAQGAATATLLLMLLGRVRRMRRRRLDRKAARRLTAAQITDARVA